MISELRKSLAKVFGTQEKKKRVYEGVLSRLISVVVVICFGIVVISAVAVETILSVLHKASTETTMLADIIAWLTPLASFTGVALLSAITMRWLPAKRPKFKEAIAGGIASALLLYLLKILVTQAIQHTDLGSYYGSAFTLVLVLFWVYFTMQVFLYGAEYAAELGRRRHLEKQQEEPEIAESPLEIDEPMSESEKTEE